MATNMRASPRSHVALTLWMAVLPAITAFWVPPSSHPRPFFGVHHEQNSFTRSPRCQSRLCMSSVETDPFQMLNLSPTANKMEIKHAYKRMALKYHPDVATNRDTPVHERKKANEEFAKINWAYAQLSGRDGDTSRSSSSSSSSTSSTSSTSSRTSTTSSSYAPPHRRTSTSSSSFFYPYNPDQPIWADIMPKWTEQYQTYNSGGTSFDKKLEDLFNGAADGVASGGDGDMFRDCVEFLENNVFGYSSGEECDVELHILLTTGSVEELGMKIDDTELVVQQLDTEMSNLANELRHAYHRIAHTKLYLEKKELEKKVADLEARTSFLDGDLKKARRLLLALQTRHEQLGGGSGSSSRSTSLGVASSRETSSDGGTASSSSACKHEGYGNIGRGPGSSRRSRGRETQSTASNCEPQTPSPSISPLPRQQSPVTPPSWQQPSKTRPQFSTTTRETYSNGSTASYSSASSEGDAWIHAEFGSVYTGRGRGRDTQSTASSKEQSPSSSTSPPTRLESPVPPPTRRQTSTTRSQSSTTTTTSIDGDMTSNSIEEDAWKHERYGNIGRGPGSSRHSRGRDTRSARCSQQQKFESADPSPPPRNEKKHTKSKKRDARKATQTDLDQTWMEKLAGVFNSRPKSR